MRVGGWLLVVLALAGCSSEDETDAPTGQPPGWDDGLRLVEAADEDPAPDVVEVSIRAMVATLELESGKQTELWTYNGSLPGPLIRAKQGDRLIVHFANDLPVPTTVHWHGVRVPAAMDGVPEHTQLEIPPGGTFEYEFELPDAGMFWYHPHVTSAEQVGRGLYGAILVSGPDEPEGLGDELPLVLSDISLEESGAVQPPDAGGDLATLFGREGTHVLANGRVRPTISPRAGLAQRWRIVNAARSRYFQLELLGHELTRIGGDGGLLPEAITGERLLLAPGERADVVIAPTGDPGAELALRWIPFDRGYGSTEFRDPVDVMVMRFADMPAATPPAPPTVARAIEPIDISGATPIELELTQNDDPAMLELGINGVPSWEAEPLMAQVNETQVWTVTNHMDWSHPFHLHGFFFQPLNEDGTPREPLEWKDTLDVPYGDGRQKFAVRYDDRAGMWMFHCHILDHADAGMMGMLHLMR